MHALRDAILGSIFVTNGTTQIVKATVAESLLGPDPLAPAATNVGYPEYFNRPALYLEGVTSIEFLNAQGPANPFDIRPLDLAKLHSLMHVSSTTRSSAKMAARASTANNQRRSRTIKSSRPNRPGKVLHITRSAMSLMVSSVTR